MEEGTPERGPDPRAVRSRAAALAPADRFQPSGDLRAELVDAFLAGHPGIGGQR
jgi:hypothetical protein